MHIYCSQCNQKFTSVILDQTLALKELTEALVKHGRGKHRGFCDTLNQAILKVSFAAGGFLTLTELAIVPKEEKFIVDNLISCQDIMMAAIGFSKAEKEEVKLSGGVDN